MNLIIIEDKISKRKIHVQLEYKNNILFYCGYYYDNGKIVPTNDIKKYFSFLKLHNKQYVEDYNGYEVYLDRDTNLKHFYKGNKEDYYMFFLHNGEDISLCGKWEVDKKRKTRAKKFAMRLYTVCATGWTALMLAIILNEIGVITVYDPMTYYKMFRYTDEDTQQISISATEEMICDSSRLTTEEKRYLCNEKFLSDALHYANGSEMVMLLLERLDNIDIVDYTEEEKVKKTDSNGYYSFDNILHVRDYDEDAVAERCGAVVAHEYAHLFQADSKYCYISEPFATLVSLEYFGKDPKSYKEEMKRLKVLMEIIGYEPVCIYNYSGDASALKAEVGKYLSEQEAAYFFKTLEIQPGHEDTTEANHIIDSYLSKMYNIKYGVPIENDILIRCIYNEGNYVKYYLNSDFINQENCYMCVGIQDPPYNPDEPVSYVKSLTRDYEQETEGTIMGIIYNCNENIGVERFSRDGENNQITIVLVDGTTQTYPINEAIQNGILVKNYIYYQNASISSLLNDYSNEYDRYFIIVNGEPIPLDEYTPTQKIVPLPTIYDQFPSNDLPSQTISH